MSAFASIATFYVSPLIEKASDHSALKLIAVLVGIPGFYLVFRSVHGLLSQFRYREILGVWHYVTSSFEDLGFKDGNFARMRIYLNDDEELDYLVDLYENQEGLFSPGTSALRGTASSDSIRYSGAQKKLSILYHVQYAASASKNPDRYGRLFLSLTEKKTLEGVWVSDLHRREISSGTMYAARPKAFKRYMESLRSAAAHP